MQNSPTIPRHAKPSEEGFLLLACMFLLAVLVLSLAVAAPAIARSIQRDREVETMRRGKQYIRAVQLYYRKFHAYPPSADALVKTNDIRFLRKRYIDPMTGKDDWKPVLFGQNKVPIAMGFFGQPLATGSALAGIGPSGGNGLNGANGLNGGTSSPFGSPNPTMNPSLPSSPSTTPTSSTGSSDNSSTSSTSGGGSGSSTTSGSNTSGTSFGQTFGGAGIIGFEPASSKQSILIYKKKDHYNEWEFTYDPIMDTMKMTGGNTGMIGQPAGNMTSPFGIPGITTPGSNPTGGSGSSSTSAPMTPPETSVPPQ
jgi:type II secretory pathway pseudopilin PulG